MVQALYSTACVAVILCASFSAALPSAKRAAVPNQNPFPVADGFPNPSTSQLQAIFRTARGTLPNGGPPHLSADTFKSLQLIATNEMAEVSLYETCLEKIKAGGPGFGVENFDSAAHRDYVIATFEVFYAQEEIHALIGQGGLQANGQQPIAPSQYKLNTNTYQDCLATANILGDNVLGTSQGVINQAIEAGDLGLPAQLDSLIAQEGQQSGFLRSEMKVNGKKYQRVPGAMPGYTGSTREWLFSLLQQCFIKPGTDTNKIDLPVKYPLTVQNKNIAPVDQTLKFTVKLNPKTGNNATFSAPISNPQNLYITYISGLQNPFSVPVKITKQTKKELCFTASFPAYTYIVNGFAIAALTPGNSYADFQTVSDESIAGPATIELNN